MRPIVLAVLLLGLPTGRVHAEEPTPPPADSRVESAREDLTALRFEQALAKLDALLADPALDPGVRLGALGLRLEAHISSGNLAAADDDYRGLLDIDPGYEPQQVPNKILARLVRVRDAVVGSVTIDLDPADAHLTVDGRPIRAVPPGSPLRLKAGSRSIRAERRGFDPAETRIQIDAGKQQTLVLHLTPNARTVVLRTEPDGVEISVDGIRAGETSRDPASGAAELRIEDLALGPHVIEFSKECFRTVRSRDDLSLDLLDRSPKVYQTVTLERARARLVPRSTIGGAEIRVDGEVKATLPADAIDVCPGRREIDVRAGGRLVWWGQESFADQEDREIALEPRPNAVVLGAEGWPDALKSFEGRLSLRASLPRPDRADLSVAEAWRDVVLPSETDLAIAVLDPPSIGAPVPVVIWSPVLRTLERLEGRIPDAGRPSLTAATSGLRLVDSGVGGKALIAEVVPGSPAAAASIAVGDRVLAVGENRVGSAAEVVAALRSPPPGTSFGLLLASPSGATRTVRIETAASPVLLDSVPNGSQGLLAAWCSVIATTSPTEAATATANLAMRLYASGRWAPAAEAWRRVAWPERRGVGAGTASYYLGRSLVAAGREREAREAFERARASGGTAPDDDALDVAPAAVDHLADLGVAPSGAPDPPR